MSNSLIDILSSSKVKEFIQTHLNDDPVALVLQSKKYPELPIREIVAQIQSRKKAQTKLPEWFAHEEVIFPHGVSMEQCSSEETAKYKAGLVRGKSVSDLTGGFGIDLFYLSQQFEKAHYIEKSQELVELANHNFENLKAKNIELVNTSAEEYLTKETESADLYFIDPARRDETNQKVFQIEDCTPDLNLIIPLLLKRKAEVLIKLSPLLDIRLALEVLSNVKEVHVVSVKNECKELLFLIAPSHQGSAERIAVNLTKDQKETFVFSDAQEEVVPQFSLPLDFLYEPNASIMKAGGFNAVSHAFNIKKLNRNSHLYTSDAVVKNFPGRTFKIIDQTVLNKKKLKPFLPQSKANITVRNYPMTVKEIRKKTGIREGGEVYLFATTLMDGGLAVLVCEKL
ncbi:Methyltransferase domain-containing protein [Reichenbachiella faecimaris]|uniref:Methyltransferase domain-containing protein n=1 Tax=Reichenbachiella faecimaris TaxID=692418 RepID=A0A1W2GBY9_REIFA|nr:RsmD family RNA methyltransferase [Reichenbachiella faecimaris]SMD34143.1 Methyltransferase domain-containing protein [Reichenbachiella faecimaris]